MNLTPQAQQGKNLFCTANVWIRQILFTFQSLLSLKVNNMSLIVSVSVKVFRLINGRFLRETTHCKASVAIAVN